MKYLILAEINSTGAHLSFITKAETTNEAMGKVLKYCNDEGFPINKIKVYEQPLNPIHLN